MCACTLYDDNRNALVLMQLCVLLVHPAARGPSQPHHSHCSHGPDGHLPDGGSRQPALGCGTRHGGEWHEWRCTSRLHLALCGM